MPERIETDYLVVGAGASGMAFADTLVSRTDADVVLVDRRHAPGGHWLDAYPFVRLHQPSANYGVESTVLGDDRVDEVGPNAGFYERASAAEICDYFARVLDERLRPTGRVRFLGTTEYRGPDGEGRHLLGSRLTGEETTVAVRRRLVDATYVESEIPSRHVPPFTVDPGVRLMPPNDLVDLAEPADGFTVIGAGKTAMDTCTWLLDAGVDPDAAEWIRPRDPWLFNRAFTQPLDQVGSYMQLQASWVAAAAHAADMTEFAHRLEDDGVFLRLRSEVEPRLFRGATISEAELERLRAIERVVGGAGAKVRHIGTNRIVTDDGDVATDPGRVHVDCTAAGLPPTELRPVFEPGRVTLQYVTIGFVPWGAATIAAVEARTDDDGEKNRLCPTLTFTGDIADVAALAHASMSGLVARSFDPDLNSWNEGCRLNPARGAADHLDDPRIAEALASMGANFGTAMKNLPRLARA